MNEKRKYCILIVDDSVYSINTLYAILSPLYMIKMAKNGQMAIKIAEKHKPDLILLDIIMPDMSGFEVIAQLKESDLTKEIPVIFISGLDNSKEEEKGRILGAVDYITKPYDESTVKMKIGMHLKQ